MKKLYSLFMNTKNSLFVALFIVIILAGVYFTVIKQNNSSNMPVDASLESATTTTGNTTNSPSPRQKEREVSGPVTTTVTTTTTIVPGNPTYFAYVDPKYDFTITLPTTLKTNGVSDTKDVYYASFTDGVDSPDALSFTVEVAQNEERGGNETIMKKAYGNSIKKDTSTIVVDGGNATMVYSEFLTNGTVKGCEATTYYKPGTVSYRIQASSYDCDVFTKFRSQYEQAVKSFKFNY